MSANRPVFVIGPERSGASLLAWSLGQHAGLRTVPSTRWLGPLLSYLRDAHDEATQLDQPGLGVGGVTAAEFYRTFGDAALRVVGGDSGADAARIVDATPEHAFCVVGLRWLFPDAVFISVIRDVSSVVRLLVDPQVSKLYGSRWREEKAYGHWLSTVRACLAAERALGSATVLRVLHRDLTSAPEPTLRRCLEFLGADWEPACLRPLHGVFAELEPQAEPVADAADVSPHVPFRSEAEALSRALLGAAPHIYEPDAELVDELERAVWRVGRHRRTGADAGTESGAEEVREAMEAVMPPGSHAVVVSRGDDRLLRLNGCTAGHFPQGDDGGYLGYHPADSDDAIARLEILRARGARFLVIPATSSWWLEHYTGFRRHLDEHYPLVVHRQDVCVIYSLDPHRRLGLDLRDGVGLVPDGGDADHGVQATQAGDVDQALARRVESLEAELAQLRAERPIRVVPGRSR